LTTSRDLALAEAGAVEQPHFGSASFRVNGKIFAQLSSDDEVGLVKLSLGAQEWLLAAHPGRCWSDLHWGRHGWTHLRWAEVDAALLKDLIRQSWAIAARRSEIEQGSQTA
jgi:hypothetical protein